MSWWGRELGSLVPRGLPMAAWSARPAVLQSTVGGKYSLLLDEGERSAIFDDVSEIAPALATAGAGKEVVLRLPAADVLTTSVDLPDQAVSRARDILSLEIESATPFTADEATFDYLLDARSLDGMRRVKTFIAKNSVIERRVSELAQADVSVVRVDVEGAQGINLLPGQLRPKRRIPFRREVAVVLGSTLLLAASAYHRQDAAIRLLETRKAALLSETEGVRSAATQANDAAANIANLDNTVKTNPSALYVLAALTATLGDDVWLTELKISGREVTISGAASSASDALAKIEASPAFAKAAFSSTVFTDKNGKDETFSANFHVESQTAGAEDLIGE